MIRKLLVKYVQFIKFSIVGISNTLISWLIYYCCLKVGVFYLFANIISFFGGMTNGFIWNKKWVFKMAGSTKKTFVKYTAVNLCTLILSTGLLFIFVDFMRIGKFSAQVLVTLTVLFINYFSNKLWTFSSL